MGIAVMHAWKAKMNRQRGRRALVLPLAAIALLSLAACGDAAPPLLPRDTVVPVGAVTQYFPDVTKEGSTGPNETSVGKPIASRSVVFLSADGKKKVTVSIDQYASASDATSAYQTAVQGSKAAPGFNPAAAPSLGEEAFAGTSQVGAEMHFGLGARDGRLIVSATHAGDIPVTPDNTSNLISLGGAELTTAKQLLGPSGSN
jgi:predicted small lipoprotein YifL